MTTRILAVEKLQQLANLAKQSGNSAAAEALTVAAALVTARLKPASAQKTLRDEMAMSALMGLIGEDKGRTSDQLAARAYQLADAMLEAREV